MTFDVSERLLDCINQMGHRHTNAVLLALNGADTIKPYQRYPAQPYYFGDGHWRVYYHCHESSIVDAREHGHFHFFTQTDPDKEWSHVIALGMNSYGLPINLFTTNLWVTDGAWFDVHDFDKQIQILHDSSDDDLPLSWFKYMLLLFADKVNYLLHKRDAELKRLCPNNRQHCFIDRTIYYLSHTDIDLNRQLFLSFSDAQTAAKYNEENLYHG